MLYLKRCSRWERNVYVKVRLFGLQINNFSVISCELSKFPHVWPECFSLPPFLLLLTFFPPTTGSTTRKVAPEDTQETPSNPGHFLPRLCLVWLNAFFEAFPQCCRIVWLGWVVAHLDLLLVKNKNEHDLRSDLPLEEAKLLSLEAYTFSLLGELYFLFHSLHGNSRLGKSMCPFQKVKYMPNL